MILPPDFTEQIKAQLGDEWPAFLNALASPAPTSIRFNLLKNINWQENIDKVKWEPNGVYLSTRPVFTLDPAFHAGAYYVQEASSMFVGEAVRQLVPAGRFVRALDLCAAPGGKTTLLQSALSRGSLLLANEVIRPRYQILRENLMRWGAANIFSSNLDSSAFGALQGYFGLVLVDAPCSGEGLFRKDADAVGEWSPDNVQLCCGRQKRILADAVALLEPGGILLYSTCTYNRFENEENAAWLADQFGVEPLRLQLHPEWNIVEREWGYQFYPHRVRGEGFYLAAFRRPPGPAFQMPRLKDKAPTGLALLSRPVIERLEPWVRDTAALAFFENKNGMIVAIPRTLEEEARFLSQALGRVQMGTEIGSFKNKDFVPAHALALSPLAAAGIPRVALDRDTALLFLKKENIRLPHQPMGWMLASYQGLGLGWAKGLANRLNNYLPKEWRIRMDIN
ncbi:MAG: hypothetical protein KDC66_00680 [Phaeodactylibacter sp.]|nr:hypothetical protein [Phaeodactylibacter sp.]MCB9273279.1 RNA methyltransferase [Lewinellaceae bacterium]